MQNLVLILQRGTFHSNSMLAIVTFEAFCIIWQSSIPPHALSLHTHVLHGLIYILPQLQSLDNPNIMPFCPYHAA